MVFWIRMLRLLAILTGITGAMIKVNAAEPGWRMFGIGLAVSGFFLLIVAYALSTVVAARQTASRRRR